MLILFTPNWKFYLIDFFFLQCFSMKLMGGIQMDMLAACGQFVVYMTRFVELYSLAIVITLIVEVTVSFPSPPSSSAGQTKA